MKKGTEIFSDDLYQRVIKTTKSMDKPLLGDLVDRLQSEGVRYEDGAKTIFVLWKKGMIEFLEPKPPAVFAEYALSLHGLWFWFLTGLVMLTIPTVLYLTTAPLIYVRYLLGSLFVLYLPGATVVEALYPRGEELTPIERLALSVGLSIAVVPLIGLGLNFTPWGIRLEPVAISLASFAEVMALVALVRKNKVYRLSNG